MDGRKVRRFAMVLSHFFLALLISGFRCPASASAVEANSLGLILTVEKPGDVKPNIVDARVVRLLALYVPKESPPSDFTASGPFRATFEGDLSLRLRDTYTFFAEGRGRLTLRLNGTVALETSGEDLSKMKSQPIRLNKGKNHLVAVYESPQTGDAALRLLWSGRTFQSEPLNPALFTQSEKPQGVWQSLKLREGRFLFGQFRCEKCHTSVDNAMAELGMDAPSLADAGSHLNADWLAAWVGNPKSLRPDARMPRLIASSQTDPRAADVAAYLATVGKPWPTATSGNAQIGGRLFANLDCIACHTLPDEKDDAARVTLKYVKAKFKPEALRHYLLKPEARYVWNPMPDFHLSDPEAGDLSAFLLSLPAADLPKTSRGDPAKGRRVVESAGCLNCHAMGEAMSTAQASALSAITNDKLHSGCLANSPSVRGRAPDFVLTPDERDSLAAFLATDRSALKFDCASEFAERQIVSMRCTACHARDGDESLLIQGLDAQVQALHEKYPNPPAKEGEAWAADQRPPMLTWAGEKLRPEWMREFISGEVKYKPRYYLRARMPSFAARADWIATGLAEEHGYPPSLPPDPKPDPALTEAGRMLCGKVPNQGFSCVQCHAAAGEPPFAPFEAPSIDFEHVAERLRHNYYLRWMHDPLRIDPNSKMPRFDDAEGKTALPAFNGDAQKQFEAIWNYLLEGDSLKAPPQ